MTGRQLFSGRFQNLAGEHGTVGFKNKPDNFVREGFIQKNIAQESYSLSGVHSKIIFWIFFQGF